MGARARGQGGLCCVGVVVVGGMRRGGREVGDGTGGEAEEAKVVVAATAARRSAGFAVPLSGPVSSLETWKIKVPSFFRFHFLFFGLCLIIYRY
jgi:hypothetical protein